MVVHAIVDEIGITVDVYAERDLAIDALTALGGGRRAGNEWKIRTLPASPPGTWCDERVFTVVDDLGRLESAHADHDRAEARMRARDSEARARGEQPSGRRVVSHVLIRRLPNLPQAAAAQQQLHRAG